eukprot:scaffold381_cov138-Cylindrotheca_fusiformis.AAC.20
MEPEVFLAQRDRQSYGTTNLEGHGCNKSRTIRWAQRCGTPFMNVVANPTITPVDPISPEDHGVPSRDEALEPGTYQSFSPYFDPTQSCLVSMGWQTLEVGLKSKETLVAPAQPVVLTPDTQLRDFAPALAPDVIDPTWGAPISKVILWPELCSPPMLV